MCAFALALAVFSIIAFVHTGGSRDQAFGDFDCSADCSGAAAGYRWAELHDVGNEDECPSGNSQAFRDGCIAYARDLNRGMQVGSTAGAGPTARPFDDDDDPDTE
jgi:hypothetical protein